MSASSKIPAKHVLRGILRRLQAHKANLPEAQRPPPGSSSATMKYVLDRYRSDREPQEPLQSSHQARNQELHKLAYEYMILRQDIDERSRLQQLDTGAENQLSPREMSRRAAARAGLELPKLDPDLS